MYPMTSFLSGILRLTGIKPPFNRNPLSRWTILTFIHPFMPEIYCSAEKAAMAASPTAVAI